MKFSKQVTVFVVALLAIDFLCAQLVNAARTQHLNLLSHGALQPEGNATLQLLVLAIYVFVFTVVGAIVGLAIKQKVDAVLWASAL